MSNTFGAEGIRDPLLLVSRVLMMILFVVFGRQKLVGFGETVANFEQSGVPLPFLAAPIAVLMDSGSAAPSFWDFLRGRLPCFLGFTRSRPPYSAITSGRCPEPTGLAPRSAS
jgi:DoxX